MSGVALMRPPSPSLAQGLTMHPLDEPVDLARAVDQWHAYREVMEQHSWRVVQVEPADDCPDSVFVEDTVVVFDDVAVLTSPGAVSRRSEVDGVERAVSGLGLDLRRIEAAGATLDGGDVLKVGRTVYVGDSGRTNRAGIEALRAIVEPSGWTMVSVPTTSVLHLKSAVTALPDRTVIGYAPLVDVPDAFGGLLEVPEPSGAHVVLLGDDRLLMAADAPQSASMFRRLGYQPIEVDISEFEKLDGCVTCLSVRIRSIQGAAHNAR